MSPAQPDPNAAPPASPSPGSSWLGPGLVLAVAILVAAVGATGQVRVPPRLGFLLAAIAIAGALVVALELRTGQRGAGWTWACVIGAALVGVAAGHVLLAPGMPRVHDLMHPWGIWAYGRAVGEGRLWPRWIPYLGCGVPLLQFYGPLNFLLALPAVLLGLSPVTAFKSVLLIGHTLSPVAGFAGARMLGARRAGALVTAVALAFAPWRLTSFDYRGALGEATAFVFLPLVAAATLALWRRASLRRGLVLVLALSGLVLTHLLSLFTLLVALAPALIVQSWSGNRAKHGSPEVRAGWRGPRAAALAWIVALGLTAAWWVPAVGELDATSVEATTRDNAYYHYDEHGLSARDLLERRAWDQLRGSIPRTARAQEGQEGTQMPFYAGAVLFLLAWSAPWWSGERAAWAPVAGSIVAVALTTAALATAAAALPFFATVRFPWRFLSPATVLAALALGLGADAWSRRPAVARRPAWCAIGALVLVTALIWDGAPYAGAADRIPPYDGIVHWHARERGWTHWEDSMRPSPVDSIAGGPGDVVRVRDLALPPGRYDTAIDLFYPGYYEWLSPEVYRRYWRSRDASALAAAGVGYGFSEARAQPSIQEAAPYASLRTAAEPAVALASRSVSREPGRIDVRLDTPAAGGRLVVLEQAFPGWRARIDGGPWVAPEDREGFLALPLPPGARRVEFVYGYGTAARRAGLAGSAFTVLLLLAALALRRFGPRTA